MERRQTRARPATTGGGHGSPPTPHIPATDSDRSSVARLADERTALLEALRASAGHGATVTLADEHLSIHEANRRLADIEVLLRAARHRHSIPNPPSDDPEPDTETEDTTEDNPTAETEPETPAGVSDPPGPSLFIVATSPD